MKAKNVFYFPKPVKKLFWFKDNFYKNNMILQFDDEITDDIFSVLILNTAKFNSSLMFTKFTKDFLFEIRGLIKNLPANTTTYMADYLIIKGDKCIAEKLKSKKQCHNYASYLIGSLSFCGMHKH